MGIYAVDGVSGRGPVRTLSITATAADLLGEIRAPQTRSWVDKTLEEIVRTIASETGLRAVVSTSLRSIRWPYLAQTAESNVHFLGRIAAELDAICKPAGGVLLVQKRGEGISAAGDQLTPPSLAPNRLSGWSWSYKGRTVYRAAEAEWTDIATGVTHKVKAGSGKPVRRLRHPFATEAEATRAVDAVLSGAGRAEIELSASLSGFEPGLLGGGSVEVSGIEPELDGEWHLKSVTHRLDGSGLVSEFEAERGKDG